MSTSYLNSADSSKQFINKILKITHSQWIYRDISLQDKHQGCFHDKRSKELLHEISELSKLTPEEVPESSHFLLEINFTDLTSALQEAQRYWMLVVNAALKNQSLKASRGARLKRIRKRLNQKIPSRKKLSVVAIKQEIHADKMHHSSNQTNQTHHTDHPQTNLTSFIKKCPHPLTAFTKLKSNKRLEKSDF
jgi:hypothetical protein